jgi:hypothetical protein
MSMSQLIEGLEEAMSDQDNNKLDYIRKREKKRLLKPDQKGELSKLDRVAKSDNNKAAAASWLSGASDRAKAVKDRNDRDDAAKPWPGMPKKPAAGQGSRKQDKENLKSWLPKASDIGKGTDRPKPKTLLGKLGSKLKDFAKAVSGG